VSDIATLAWLQWRQTVNFLKQSSRKPARIVVALIGVAYIALLVWLRSQSTHTPIVVKGIPEPFATFAGLLLIVLLGVIFLTTDKGYVRAFASPADARFLIGSGLPERLVVSWVQMRGAAELILRAIWGFLIYALVSPAAGTSRGIVLTAAGFFALAAALPIPLLKIERATRVPAARVLAIAFFLAGGIPLAVIALAWVWPLPEWLHDGVRVGIGSAVNGLLIGSRAVLAGLYAMVGLLFVAGYAAGHDVYPELYAGSTRLLRRNERRGGTAFAIEHEKRAKHEYRAPAFLNRAGAAWALLWRDATAFGRSQQQRLIFFATVPAAVAAGAVIGIAARRAGDGMEFALTIAVSIVNVYVIGITMATTVSLGDDLRKPLFWLSADPLRSRLYAWLASTSWRPAIAFSGGLAAWAVAAGDSRIAWTGIPAALVLVVLLRSIGLALYSFFPGRADQRGPLAAARMFLAYALLVPPVGSAVALGLLTQNAMLSTAVVCGSAAIEVLLLAELASRRIEGRGAAIAQAEGE